MVSTFASLLGGARLRWPDDRPAAPLFELGQLLQGSRQQNEARIRALCHTVQLSDQTVLCRVLGRYKMFVDATDHGLSPHLMLDGYWEMWLTEALARAVRPGMTVIDIGANLGYFTLLMADLVGADGRVHAFEPNPPIAARLKHSLSLNGFGDRSVVHECALGDADGREMMLVCPKDEPKNAHLVVPPASEDGAGPAASGHLLKTRRLDSFPEIVHADVVKIDADTAEEAIWYGMTRLLTSNRPTTIFLEFARARYAAPEAFLSEIQRTGFTLGRLDLEQGIGIVSPNDVLAAPAQVDQMLVLRR